MDAAGDGAVPPPRRSWVDPRIEARPSAIDGRGEFATSEIPAGAVLKELGGRLISDIEMKVVAASGSRFSAIRVSAATHLLMSWDDPASRGNHSCEPNAWMNGPSTVVARRAIAAGEEITTDYALMTVDPDWQMACNCGSRGCRGIVTGEDWRSPALRERYRGHFVPWIESQPL
jgi:hypothetical protein